VDSTDQAAVRWYELRNFGSGWDIYQQGTYAPDDESRWMGSIAMDADGNIGMGYSVSSDQVYPSVRITGRNYNDPILGIMTWEETTVVNGAGSQTMNSRWGDYSTMSVDQTDDLSFWYTGEYLPSSGYMNWSTRINSFQLHKKLSLSSDSIVFITEDDCINGKSVILKNNSWYDIEFEDIQPDGVFPGAVWYIDAFNFSFPFTLAVGDSVELLVKVDITKDALSSGFLLDSMSIETAYKGYKIPVMLNEGLLTSIHENDKEDIFKVYPNPAQQKLNISVNGFTIHETVIYTITGQQVIQERPESGSIDISTLQPGMYIVEVTLEGRKVRRKLIIE
jgi:hypothetical protein